MSLPRPLTRPILKRIILKTLHAIDNPTSRVYSKSRNYRGMITHVVPLYLEFDRLQAQEEEEAFRAYNELLRDGFLVQDPSIHGEGVFKLTAEGREQALKPEADMKLLAVDLQSLLSRDDLRSKLRDDFYAGEFESAVMKAFKMVEEAVRTKARLTPNDHGRDLFTKAFNKTNPILKHPEAQTAGEIESLFFLMTGAYGWFRNPASHRSVTYANPQQAAQILAFANLLLDMIDQCSV